MAITPPQGAHITLAQQRRTCGKAHCTRCNGKNGAPKTGHGPYWYGYFRENKKLYSFYVGKGNAPPENDEAVKVSQSCQG